MSSRKSEFTGSFEKPASKYYEWSSEEGCFKYYDREKRENVLVPLPLTFLVLKEFHTVKGWHDKSSSGIFANEVKNIGTEPLEVKAFKGGVITRGIYKDIKDVIANAGGRYIKSIYAMTKDGEIVNFQLKGAAVKAWGDATQKGRSRLADEWVTVAEIESLKKGRVSYTVPVFKFDGSLSDAEGMQADLAYDKLDATLSKRGTELRDEVAEEVDDDFQTLTDEEVDF
jgi:hypothetical protein